MNPSDHAISGTRPMSCLSPAETGPVLYTGNHDCLMNQFRPHVADRPAHGAVASGAPDVTRIRYASDACSRALTVRVATACDLSGVTPGPAGAAGMAHASQATAWDLSTSLRSDHRAALLCPMSVA